MTASERDAIQAEFDAFIANAPKRAQKMRDAAAQFSEYPEIAELMLRIADHQAGYAEFAGAQIEPKQVD